MRSVLSLVHMQLADQPFTSTEEEVPSSAASQGVFMTMMAAASRHKAGPATSAPDNAPSVPAAHTFSRSQEEALLERIFTHPLATPSVPLLGPVKSSQRLTDGPSQAKAVDVAESLWTRAACCDPPECQLHGRVQKRKAEAERQQQLLKRQSQEPQHAAADAVPPSRNSQAQQSMRCTNADVSTCHSHAAHPGPDDDADCIILTSSSQTVHANLTDALPSASQTPHVDVSVSQPVTTQTMDPMKRMQLQALQQELMAAKQTVADLERMIRAVQQS